MMHLKDWDIEIAVDELKHLSIRAGNPKLNVLVSLKKQTLPSFKFESLAFCFFRRISVESSKYDERNTHNEKGNKRKKKKKTRQQKGKKTLALTSSSPFPPSPIRSRC